MLLICEPTNVLPTFFRHVSAPPRPTPPALCTGEPPNEPRTHPNRTNNTNYNEFKKRQVRNVKKTATEAKKTEREKKSILSPSSKLATQNSKLQTEHKTQNSKQKPTNPKPKIKNQQTKSQQTQKKPTNKKSTLGFLLFLFYNLV